jgi:hypothetical protein
MVVTSEVPDAQGRRTVSLDVWPLSGPQEPAPPKKARVLLAPCNPRPLAATALPS